MANQNLSGPPVSLPGLEPCGPVPPAPPVSVGEDCAGGAVTFTDTASVTIKGVVYTKPCPGGTSRWWQIMCDRRFPGVKVLTIVDIPNPPAAPVPTTEYRDTVTGVAWVGDPSADLELCVDDEQRTTESACRRVTTAGSWGAVDDELLVVYFWTEDQNNQSTLVGTSIINQQTGASVAAVDVSAAISASTPCVPAIEIDRVGTPGDVWCFEGVQWMREATAIVDNTDGSVTSEIVRWSADGVTWLAAPPGAMTAGPCQSPSVAVERWFYPTTGVPDGFVPVELQGNSPVGNHWSPSTGPGDLFVHAWFEVGSGLGVSADGLEVPFSGASTGVLASDEATIQAGIDSLLVQLAQPAGSVLYRLDPGTPAGFVLWCDPALVPPAFTFELWAGPSAGASSYTNKVVLDASSPTATLPPAGCRVVEEIKTFGSADTYRYVVEDGGGNLVSAISVIAGFDPALLTVECPPEPVVAPPTPPSVALAIGCLFTPGSPLVSEPIDGAVLDAPSNYFGSNPPFASATAFGPGGLGQPALYPLPASGVTAGFGAGGLNGDGWSTSASTLINQARINMTNDASLPSIIAAWVSVGLTGPLAGLTATVSVNGGPALSASPATTTGVFDVAAAPGDVVEFVFSFPATAANTLVVGGAIDDDTASIKTLTVNSVATESAAVPGESTPVQIVKLIDVTGAVVLERFFLFGTTTEVFPTPAQQILPQCPEVAVEPAPVLPELDVVGLPESDYCVEAPAGTFTAWKRRERWRIDNTTGGADGIVIEWAADGATWVSTAPTGIIRAGSCVQPQASAVAPRCYRWVAGAVEQTGTLWAVTAADGSFDHWEGTPGSPVPTVETVTACADLRHEPLCAAVNRGLGVAQERFEAVYDARTGLLLRVLELPDRTVIAAWPGGVDESTLSLAVLQAGGTVADTWTSFARVECCAECCADAVAPVPLGGVRTVTAGPGWSSPAGLRAVSILPVGPGVVIVGPDGNSITAIDGVSIGSETRADEQDWPAGAWMVVVPAGSSAQIVWRAV